MNSFRALAYQYIELSTDTGDKDEQESREKFKGFLQDRLDLKDLLGAKNTKISKFSYPDLHCHHPAEKGQLQAEFAQQTTLCDLKDIYVVHVRNPSPQIGFTVSVAMVLSFRTAEIEELKKYLTPGQGSRSPFHIEMDAVWKRWVGKRRTIPVVLFCPDESDSQTAWARQGVFSMPTPAQLIAGETIRVERGFPYVSYIVHSRHEIAVREDIHRCDFALLTALPSFIEKQMELVTDYRKELNKVLDLLNSPDKFSEAQRKYTAEWMRFEEIQRLVPITVAAVQRIVQKYPEPSLYAIIANDNIALIEATVAAAITATEQVRSNLHSVAQQKLQQSTNTLHESMNTLQGSTNTLQRLYTYATAGLVLIAGLQLLSLLGRFGPTNMRISGPVSIQEPLLISQEPQAPVPPVPMLATEPLLESVSAEVNMIELRFPANVTEMTADVNIPDGPTNPPEKVALIKDGTLAAEGPILSQRPMQGVRVYFRRDLLLPGNNLILEITQRDSTLRIPILLRTGDQ